MANWHLANWLIWRTDCGELILANWKMAKRHHIAQFIMSSPFYLSRKIKLKCVTISLKSFSKSKWKPKIFPSARVEMQFKSFTNKSKPCRKTFQIKCQCIFLEQNETFCSHFSIKSIYYIFPSKKAFNSTHMWSNVDLFHLCRSHFYRFVPSR